MSNGQAFEVMQSPAAVTGDARRQVGDRNCTMDRDSNAPLPVDQYLSATCRLAAAQTAMSRVESRPGDRPHNRASHESMAADKFEASREKIAVWTLLNPDRLPFQCRLFLRPGWILGHEAD